MTKGNLSRIYHFVKPICCTNGKPVLMYLDMYVSHIGTEMFDFDGK